MAKCTGMGCPMQVGYKVDGCDYKDCPRAVAIAMNKADKSKKKKK